MGFKGHFAPGMFFIAGSIWHLVNGLERYYRCKRIGTPGKLRLMASYPGIPFLGKRYSKIHAEALFLLVAGVLDVIGEFRIGIGPRNTSQYWINPSSVQHIVMLTLLCVRSTISLICYYTKRLPHEADYLTTGLLPVDYRKFVNKGSVSQQGSQVKDLKQLVSGRRNPVGFVGAFQAWRNWPPPLHQGRLPPPHCVRELRRKVDEERPPFCQVTSSLGVRQLSLTACSSSDLQLKTQSPKLYNTVFTPVRDAVRDGVPDSVRDKELNSSRT
ncbi:unnamed protein product [Cyprideis torosa]|uniref:Uncharacterized protein n=1 Tax=Cyprideis torosa TaxID=163714 RepID=A0A7R8WEQ5_9CRUS|nr:unnamed protein product [Cyprideis torosa]CAG0893180.1 unnamed protein product [Cyprideis torosa]